MRDMFDTVPPPAEAPRPDPAKLDRLAKMAMGLGREVVEVAGFLDLIDSHAAEQGPVLQRAREGAQQIIEANRAVTQAVETIRASTERSLAAVETSVRAVHQSGERSQSVAEWVQSLDKRMVEVSETLKEVRKNNGAVTSIAAQVNILAINAKIEAARAGDAGRGFAVVAEAVNDLSRKTSAAAAAILDSLTELTKWIDRLRSEAEAVAREAATVLADGEGTDAALTSIAENVRSTRDDAGKMAAEAKSVERAGREFGAYFDRIEAVVAETVGGVSQARDRVNALVDRSEGIVQQTVAAGGAADDAALIDFVQDRAAQVGALFEAALAEGAITQRDLFDFRYAPIPGTDPPQFTAPFLALTDRVLPPILEGALKLDPKIVFCAAVTPHGYLPTHNRKFSHPQRSGDPAWNAANSRNRRMFDDRVGLKAGRNREPFLMQIYRRDMGGGEFKMMKDLSAPITVGGKPWGGLRMGVNF